MTAPNTHILRMGQLVLLHSAIGTRMEGCLSCFAVEVPFATSCFPNISEVCGSHFIKCTPCLSSMTPIQNTYSFYFRFRYARHATSPLPYPLPPLSFLLKPQIFTEGRYFRFLIVNCRYLQVRTELWCSALRELPISSRRVPPSTNHTSPHT